MVSARTGRVAASGMRRSAAALLERSRELIRRQLAQLKALNPLEAQMLRYFRTWPQPTREAFIVFASFFADEDPVTYNQRVAHEQLRRLKSEAVRRRAYAYLTFLTEGGLTPDLQEAFGLLDSAEPQSVQTKSGVNRLAISALLQPSAGHSTIHRP